MKQKKFYLNKTIFVKNIFNFWPIWGIYSIYQIVFMPLSLYFNFVNTSWDNSLTSDELLLFRLRQLLMTIDSGMEPTNVFLFSMIAAIAVFSYLFNSRSTHTIHALPFSRKELFVTNYVSGLSMIIIPLVLAFLFSMFVCIGFGFTNTIHLLKWLITMIGMTFFAYSFAVLTIMITGHIIAAPIYYIVFNSFFFILRSMINLIISLISYGFSDSDMFTKGDFLSPLYYFYNKRRENASYLYTGNEIDISESSIRIGGSYIFWYVLVAVLMIVAAYILYKKRELERTGDIITVPFIKPIFRWSSALFGSIIVAAVLTQAFFYQSYSGSFTWLLILAIFGGICLFFIAEMLLQKQWFVFNIKSILECAAFITIYSIFLICIKTDAFGFERKIPELADIDSITVSSSYIMDITEKNEIDNAIAFHKLIIDSKKNNLSYVHSKVRNTQRPVAYVTLTYQLKNDETIKRDYILPASEEYIADSNSTIYKLTELENNPNYIIKYLFTDNFDNIKVENGYYVNINRDNDMLYEEKQLSKEQLIYIIEALKDDILEGSFKIYSNYNESISTPTYVNSINYTIGIQKGSRYSDYSYFINTAAAPLEIERSVVLTFNSINTIEALKDINVIHDEKDLVSEYELNNYMTTN